MKKIKLNQGKFPSESTWDIFFFFKRAFLQWNHKFHPGKKSFILHYLQEKLKEWRCECPEGILWCHFNWVCWSALLRIAVFPLLALSGYFQEEDRIMQGWKMFSIISVSAIPSPCSISRGFYSLYLSLKAVSRKLNSFTSYLNADLPAFKLSVRKASLN